jgi:ABC-type nitrate/sulfonate/bicarbonate transport system substrate-binding protein
MSKKIIGVTTTILILLIGVIIFLTSRRSESEGIVIRLGIPNQASGVAPIIVVDKLNLLEKHAPGVRLELTIIESSTAINEAIIANNIDGAAINNTNFLIGSERGIPYRIFSTLAYGSTSIQTNDPDRIRSFADITENDRIALMNLTGSSALLLYLASEKYFGSHDALENNIVIMDVASAELAFINRLNDITVHSPSFLGRLRTAEAGVVTILEERDLFENGLVNWNLVFSNAIFDKHQNIIGGLYSALQDAIDLIESKDERAISIITEWDGIKEKVFLENLDLGYFKYVLDDFSSLEIIIDIALRIDLISSRLEVSNLVFESSPALNTGK